MTLAEKIFKAVQKLPEPVQTEVLDFVDFVNSRRKDLTDSEWKSFSLSSALRGMGEEANPEYSPKDLKERFQSVIFLGGKLSFSGI